MRLWVLLFVVTLDNAWGQQEDNYPHSGLSDLIPSVVKQYKDRILEYLEKNNGSRCGKDLLYLYQNLQWGLKMLDAFGKPSSGIFEGNLKWIGNYHECTNIYVPLNSSANAGGIHGQYCNLYFRVEAFQKAIPLTLGICIPESCSSVPLDHFQDAFSSLSASSFNVSVTEKSCQPVSKKLIDAAVTVIVLISFFVMLAIIGSSITVFEYFSERKSDGGSGNIQTHRTGGLRDIKEFFQCFCVFSNGEKLLNTDNTEGQLLCLHGIRFLSMAWVILCHTYLATLYLIGNIIEALKLMDKWLFQIISNGFYSVDSFFLLSGFLLAHLYFQQAAKTKGKIPWLYFYIHRFVRLTPVYMVVLLFQSSLSYYMGSGPFWTLEERDPVCRDYWWYNLLYINNFAPVGNQCMARSWYLASDMQFFIVSPLILIALWRWPQLGYSVLGILMTATVAANFGITYHYELKSGYDTIEAALTDLHGMATTRSTFFQELYIKPYTRMSPYLVGILLAYYIFKRKRSNQRKLHWTALSIGWVLSSVAIIYCVFRLYHSVLSVLESGFYNAFSHALFTGGLGWVIFTCLNGQAGPINSILSFKLFIPLSRLTYCAYLIHPFVLDAYFGSLEVPLQFTHMTVVTLFLGLLVMTYSIAFVVSVLFESPVIRLDKLLRTKLTP